LILFFIYAGYMALQSAIEDSYRADRASALLAIVGLFCIPLIYWSINCPDPTQCAALHARSSLSAIETNILIALWTMVFAFWMYSFAVIFVRVRNIILERERNSTWVSKLVGGDPT
jgi:heme exporter protein C